MSKSKKHRRNTGLESEAILEILDVVLSAMLRDKYPSKVELAAGIHHYYKPSGKLSAEYKQIKKLLPLERKTSSGFRSKTPGFLHINKNGETVPTFRGLLLYLYLCKKYSLKKHGMQDYNYQTKPGRIGGDEDRKTSTLGARKHVQTIRDIGKIFSKPSVLEKAPFLKYWQDFRECGFDVIGLLLQIAEELHSQLHIDAESDNYLLRRASERYFVEAENYCYERLGDTFYSDYPVLKGKITVDELNKLAQTRHKYRRHMIALLKGWIQKRLEIIDYIDDKRKGYDIARDTSLDKNKIILLSDLALKFDTDIANVSKALSLFYNNDPDKPDYYPYDARQYLVTNTCLIPVHEIDRLKPLLSNGMNFLEVCALFENHEIPESCHQEIIPKLGFEIIRMLGDQWNDTKKWFIVERPLSNIESSSEHT